MDGAFDESKDKRASSWLSASSIFERQCWAAMMIVRHDLDRAC